MNQSTAKFTVAEVMASGHHLALVVQTWHPNSDIFDQTRLKQFNAKGGHAVLLMQKQNPAYHSLVCRSSPGPIFNQTI